MVEFSKKLRLTLPVSRLPEPENFWQRSVYTFWWLWAYVHPFFRDLFLKLHFLKHSGRQDFLLGKLVPNTDLQAFLKHAGERGYGNQFIAWWDDGEMFSLRRLDPADYHFQYHLRVFRDGEVRGHYEYTPEFHPVLHTKEIGFSERRDDFMKDLAGWIEPLAGAAIVPAPAAAEAEPEMEVAL